MLTFLANLFGPAANHNVIAEYCNISPAAGRPGRLYTFVIRYDDKTSGEESRVLTFRMFGPLEDWRVWAALRWAASAVISVSREWRGVLWEGWPECAEGHTERIYLNTPDKVDGVRSLAAVFLFCA